MRSVRPILAVFLIFILAHPGAVAKLKSKQDAVIVRSKGTFGLIPHTFHSYSLFLVCKKNWLRKQKDANLSDIYADFALFGNAIGDRNAAIWFTKQEENTLNSDDVDVNRSLKFCRAWHLDPKMGPYVVFTTSYPDEEHLSDGLPDHNAVFSMNGASRADVSNLLLNVAKMVDPNPHLDPPPERRRASPLLPQDLKKDPPIAPQDTSVSPATSPPNAIKPAKWVELLSSVQQLINKFGCAWSFKVDAGPVKANLHSCNSKTT